MLRLSIFALLAVSGFAQPLVKGPNPPVILVNGYQLVCPGVPVPTTDTFGRLEQLLNDSGRQVRFFDNCLQGRLSIEKLGQAFGEFLSKLEYDDGSPVTEVDIIAHSMGGLIVRCYLSGRNDDGAYFPPFPKRIRKLITIGTPHFGAEFSGAAPDLQAAAMIPGTRFLWELGTWNQFRDDLRGVDTLTIAGRSRNRSSDGLVTAISASSYFIKALSGDDRTRVVIGCHTTGFGGIILGCNAGEPGIANVSSADHPSWPLIRGFLDGESLPAPDEDSELAANGALWISYTGDSGELSSGRDLVASLSAPDVPVETMTSLNDSPVLILARTALRDTTLELNVPGKDPLSALVVIEKGVKTIAFKTGLTITSVESASYEEGVYPGPASLVPLDAHLRIRGLNLESATRVTLDGADLEILSKSAEDGLEVATSDKRPGASVLTVLNDDGSQQHATRIVFGLAPARIVSDIPSVSGGTIRWSEAKGSTGYALWIGSESGRSDLFEQGFTTNLESELPVLPSGLVFARLWTLSDGDWSFRETAVYIP